jgi:preprotein translocase subunit SecE
VLQVQVLPGLPVLKGTMYKKMMEFFTEARQELRKVTWPGRKEVTASTGVVLVVVTFFVGMVVIVDWAIRLGMGLFFKI